MFIGNKKCRIYAACGVSQTPSKKDRSEECEPMAESFKRKGIPEDKVCLYVLGKICVCSECGYLPDYVVERLEEISEYSCNHMG